jgi:ATP-binding cassette subfamily C protein
MKQTLKDFVQEFYTFSKKRLFWLTTGLFASSALEGFSLLLVIPFLYAAGVSGSPSALQGGTAIPLATSKEGHTLLIILFVYLLIIIGQEFLKRYTSITITAIKAGFSRHLSDRFYEAFARSKWQVIIAQRRSDIANALTNELKTIDVGTQVLMQTGSMLPSALIQLVISFIISPPVTLCALTMGLFFYVCMKPMNKKLGNLADTLNSVLKDSLSDINEHLGGIKEIKGYGAEQVHLQRFARKTKETEERFVQFVSMFSTSNFIYNSTTFLALTAFIYIAVSFFHIDIARLLVLFMIFMRIWPLMASFQTGMQFFILLVPAWKSFSARMHELSSAREEYSSSSETQPFELKKEIEVNNLTFSYGNNGRATLEKVSMLIPAHSFTALTGLSGSGKSTFIDLMLGLLEPGSGEIIIDGEKLRPDMIPAWRATIGFVPQDTFLFNGSVRENLLWARPDASDNDIWQALKLSAAEEFIRELPEGLETGCGDRGTRFSGGQRQRIALARALLRKPSLLILDEATSSLDNENEKKIQDAIRGLRGRMTILIVAHRLSTIEDADQIIVLDEGMVREKGTYSDLMAAKNGKLIQLAREHGKCAGPG